MMYFLRSIALVLCAALAVPSFSAAQGTARQGDSTLVLEPGDVVRVEVWREKDLTGDFAVDESSRLTLPMLGVVSVGGRPWVSLRDSLIAEYQKQLRNPSVNLTPLRRVQVLGEVPRPGQYLADPTLSLAGVIALAGGATPYGDLRRVRVVRHGKTIVQQASIESLLLENGVHSDDQIFVDRRPWLERNGAIVASTLLSTAGIIITIIRR